MLLFVILILVIFAVFGGLTVHPLFWLLILAALVVILVGSTGGRRLY